MMISELDLDVTEQCQLACDYCYHAGSRAALPPEQLQANAERAIRWACELTGGPLTVNLTGGEPLCELGILRYLFDHEWPQPVAWRLSSNLLALDAEAANLLGKHDVGLLVSLDGCEYAHNAYRRYAGGRGSWAEAVTRLPLALSVDPQLTARWTVLPDTVGHLLEGVRCLTALGVRRIAPVMASSAEGWGEQELAELGAGVKAVAEWCAAEPSPPWIHWLARAEAGRERGKPEQHGCGAGRTMLAVDVLGRVWPCHRFCGSKAPDDSPHMLGRVGGELVDLGAYQQVLRRDARCEGCPAVVSCRGQCLWERAVLGQSALCNPAWRALEAAAAASAVSQGKERTRPGGHGAQHAQKKHACVGVSEPVAPCLKDSSLVVSQGLCGQCQKGANPAQLVAKWRKAAPARQALCIHGGQETLPHVVGRRHYASFVCRRARKRVTEIDCWLCRHYHATVHKATEQTGDRGLLVLLRRQGYRIAHTRTIIPYLQAAGWRIEEWEAQTPSGELIERIAALPEPPVAVLRWEEHGCLFASRAWRKTVAWMYDQGIAPLSLDFGWLAHYDTVVIDRYLPGPGAGGCSAIREDWPDLPTVPMWDGADPRFSGYRDRVLAYKAEALDAGPLTEPGYVLLWVSFSTGLARRPFTLAHKDKWLRHARDAVEFAGYRPVLKDCPCPGGPALPEGTQSFNGRDPVQNARLALFARNNVLIASSVSNELLLWGVPVTALGRSWFTGLGVFNEPVNWGALPEPAPLDQANRARYLNWWLTRSAWPDQAPAILEARLRECRERHFGADYRALYQGVYETYGGRYRMAKGRHESVCTWLAPQLNGVKRALDVGCGQGEIVRWLLKRGVDARGVDVVETKGWQPRRRFDLGDVRRLPYEDKGFDLVLALDMLEHLAPAHVRLALRELARVGKRVMVDVYCGPAVVRPPAGWQNLHQSVHAPEWWRREIGAAGLVIEECSTGRGGRLRAAYTER